MVWELQLPQHFNIWKLLQLSQAFICNCKVKQHFLALYKDKNSNIFSTLFLSVVTLQVITNLQGHSIHPPRTHIHTHTPQLLICYNAPIILLYPIGNCQTNQKHCNHAIVILYLNFK